MARQLTNKQVAVLEELRRHPDGIDSKRLAAAVQGDDVECPDCGGSALPQEADFARWREFNTRADYDYPEPVRCGACYGRGERPARRFDYATARLCLERLVKVGLAERRAKLDEWGDVTGGVVYAPAAVPNPDDPLEQAWQLPTVEETQP